MVESGWKSYNDDNNANNTRLYSANWHLLFQTSSPADHRSELMRYILITLVAALFMASLSGQTINLHVFDEAGLPVSNASTEIAYLMGSTADSHKGTTDQNGLYSAQGHAYVGVYLEVSKDGYYTDRVDTARKDTLPAGELVDLPLILRRIKTPVSLYARQVGVYGASTPIPVENQWVGYDFEVGDWIQPFGKGKTADIQFNFKTQFVGWKESDEMLAKSRGINSRLSEKEFRMFYGKWNAELGISFAKAKEGILQDKQDFLPYSALKLPSVAPKEGYQPIRQATANSYSPAPFDDEVGYFIRSRVKLDDNGNITSANYSKIIGDIRFSPVNGMMQFTYYYNPVANDQNLEFDTTKNLFPASTSGTNIGAP